MLANRVRLFLFVSALLALAPATTLLRGQSSQPAVPRDQKPAAAPARDFSQDVPAHLSFVDGQVTLERGGKLEPAEPNLALLTGDRIHTLGGRVEILFADGSTLGVDKETEIDLLSDSLVRLLDGTLRLTIPRTTADLDYRIDAPAGSIEIKTAGEYRVDTGVDQHGEPDVAVTVVRGSADLANVLGRTTVRAGRQAVTTAKEAPSLPYAVNLANWDEFDQWSDDRRASHVTTSSAAYVPEAVQPYSSTLDDYGTWTTEPVYGAVWYPRVAEEWHPYSQGRWSYSGYYGWLWVGIDRWAWPTHHYGRWGFNDHRWFWIPGQSWSPAWVAWGYAPGYVGWCPLGYDNRSVIGWTAIGTQTVSAFKVFDPFAAWTVMPANRFAPNVWVTEHAVAKNVIPPTTRDAFTERPAAPSGPRVATPRDTLPPLGAPTRPHESAGARPRASTGPFDAARVPVIRGGVVTRDPIRSTIIGAPVDASAAVDRRMDRGGGGATAAGGGSADTSRAAQSSAQDPARHRAEPVQIDVPRADLNRGGSASRTAPRQSDPSTYSAPARSSDTPARVIPRNTDPSRSPAPGVEAVGAGGGRSADRTPPAVSAPPASAPSSRHAEPAAGRAPATPSSSAPQTTAPARGGGSGGGGSSSSGSSGGGSGRGGSGGGATAAPAPAQAAPPAAAPAQAAPRGGGGRGRGGA